MAGSNRVTLIGTITDLHFSLQGAQNTPVLELTVGGNAPSAFYLPASCLGKYAQAVHTRLAVGDAVHIDGHLRQTSWGTGEVRHNRTTVAAATINRLSPGPVILDAKGQARLVASVNDVSLSGNLVRAISYGTTKAREHNPGVRFAKFDLAVEDAPGRERQVHTNYISVTTWAEQAEALRELDLRPGSGLVVCGMARNESWTGADGQPKRGVRLHAERTLVIEKRRAEQAIPELQGDADAHLNEEPIFLSDADLAWAGRELEDVPL